MQARAARREPAAGPRVSVELEVPFHDTDAMQVVWHGHYYKYFEAGRTALLRRVGLDVGDLVPSRYRFVVIESKCRHAYPLAYGERVRVEAWFRDVRNRLCVDYELTNLDRARRAARGHTVLVTLDREGRMLLETPREILDRIAN
ncbi:MAG: acyl-CoA thioesterase [Proteobacteria bacterium]|nr:acyl-CoA thioesterase [Pseudomonadota bacterium]